MRNDGRGCFRHELKFLMNKADAMELRQRLSFVLAGDLHAKDGVYTIRSLYFDDRDDSAYEEKMAGIESRRKYRIRFYNGDDSVVHLECKRKEGQYIQKLSAGLTRQEAESLVAGRYEFLLERNEKICKDFYAGCIINGMKPVVIVDYEREPFVYQYGNVRITFDSNIRAGMYVNRPFDMDMPVTHVIDRDKLILEVKYTEFLPEIIRDLLPVDNSVQLAFSKYTMCLEKRKEL